MSQQRSWVIDSAVPLVKGTGKNACPTGSFCNVPGINKTGSVAAYIALRYTGSMAAEITTAEYRALAELRYRIRKFVGEGDAVARGAGLEPQQYLLLLALRGLPEGVEATIRTLADRQRRGIDRPAGGPWLRAQEPQPGRPQARPGGAAAAGREIARAGGARPHRRIARQRRGAGECYQRPAGKRRPAGRQEANRETPQRLRVER